LAQALGLPSAGVVQIDVEMALNASIHIPKRFTVADGENSGGLHGASLKIQKSCKIARSFFY
jgi:hypothetical protein